MTKASDIGAFIFGLAAGALGLAILGLLFKPKCPNCRYSLNDRVPICPNCHTRLYWE